MPTGLLRWWIAGVRIIGDLGVGFHFAGPDAVPFYQGDVEDVADVLALE